MEILTKVFSFFAEISSKMPAIDLTACFLIVLILLVVTGGAIMLTYLVSKQRKLFKACRKINKFLAQVETVDEDNVAELGKCFEDAPQSLKDAWLKFLGVRFGFPSEFLSDAVLMHERSKDARPLIFLAISLIATGLFAFWGYGSLETVELGVLHCFALVVIGILFLAFVVVSKKQIKRTAEEFELLQDEIDSKVNLQTDMSFATDGSPLVELAGIIDAIVARNIQKDVDEPEPEGKTPIEKLIDGKTELEEVRIDREPQTKFEIFEEPQDLFSYVKEAQDEVAADAPKQKPSAKPQKREEAPKAKPVAKASTPKDDGEYDETGIRSFWEELLKERDALVNKNGELSDEGKEVVSSKIAELPALIDRMLEKGMTKSMKINAASILINSYKMFSDSPEDRRVIIRCLKRMMESLKQN